ECPMARLSQMFDVLSNVTVDAIIAPYFVSEEILAKQHFKLLKPDDLVLLDRKYPSFWLFRCILEQGGDFCARMAIDKWSVLVGNFLKTGLKEQIVEIKPSWDARKKCQKYGLPATPFKLRLIRIVLDTGEIEVLATSLLDMALYPYALFKDLYHKRWPVEEQYELFKSRIEIANFTGKSVEAVKQDFHARVFMSNLTAMLAFPVHAQITEKCKDAKLDYKINWTQALAKMKISGILLFFRKLPIRIIKKLQSLFLKNISAVRPGRKYPKKPKLIKKSYAFAYKPIS
ncbi:MAG: transposase, partial [bacterium]